MGIHVDTPDEIIDEQAKRIAQLERELEQKTSYIARLEHALRSARIALRPVETICETEPVK